MEEENENSDSEQRISKPMEQLSLNIKSNKSTIQLNTAQRTDIHEQYFREFDVFEDRSEYILPNTNLQEKIILVIDRAQDEHFTPFIVNDSKFTPLSMLKRAIQVFIKLKQSINKSSEFAVVVLNEENAKWILSFTSDMKKLKDILNKIEKCEVEDTFSLNSVFEEIKENTHIPDFTKSELPPNYIVRVVMFYGRSYTIPKIECDEGMENLLANPYFICDILITHEPVESGNHCNKIFNTLQEIDKKGLAYFFPVCRDTRLLHNCTAKLLAHPLQRPKQKLQKI